MFALLKPWGDRKCSFVSALMLQPCTHNVQSCTARLNGAFYMQIPQAQIFGFNPPAINGVGTVGGFQFELEDRGNVGLDKLMLLAYQVMGTAAKDPRLTGVFTQFRNNSPQVQVNVDRNKAKSIGISLNDIFQTMEVELGSLYVNNFTYLNRAVASRHPSRRTVPQRHRVAAAHLRALGLALAQHSHRTNPFATPPPGYGTTQTTATGIVMTPISALMKLKIVNGPPVISHYNLYRNIEMQGNAAPGHSSGEAITAMDRLAAKVMPQGVSYEWTGLQLDEIAAGPLAVLIFALGLVFVLPRAVGTIRKLHRSADRAARRAGRTVRRARLHESYAICRFRFSSTLSSHRTCTRRWVTSC